MFFNHDLINLMKNKLNRYEVVAIKSKRIKNIINNNEKTNCKNLLSLSKNVDFELEHKLNTLFIVRRYANNHERKIKVSDCEILRL